eukprot:22285-Eustigmatos_ZCMA.PRE.1
MISTHKLQGGGQHKRSRCQAITVDMRRHVPPTVRMSTITTHCDDISHCPKGPAATASSRSSPSRYGLF